MYSIRPIRIDKANEADKILAELAENTKGKVKTKGHRESWISTKTWSLIDQRVTASAILCCVIVALLAFKNTVIHKFVQCCILQVIFSFFISIGSILLALTTLKKTISHIFYVCSMHTPTPNSLKK